MQYVDVACRLLLLTVFALALASKVIGRTAWTEFVESVRAMRVVGNGATTTVAVATAAAEGLVVVLAATPLPWAGPSAFVVAAGLMICLTAAVVMVVRRGVATPCRCFGGSSTPLGPQHVVRNVLLLAVALLGLASTVTHQPADLVLGALVGVFGAVAGLLMARWDDLVLLLRG
ncbi:MauE/DoxX family redox-associated membrane protein [Nonomuraea sp. NPDC052265]|uniref:MauE/DoxX family redox-associated membrane protein n=1 Tax=Nonomuraea sp. NPDC052265 TaxID=3364374 RepID=UPI0037C5852C